MNPVDIEKARVEELRWVIMMALNAARPIGTSEIIVQRAIDPVIPGVTYHEIRRELDYLEQRELVDLERDRPAWFARLNNHGIDFVEYTVPARPGIARPAKW